MKFKVNDHVQNENNKYFQCICADKKTAVFAPLTLGKECLRVKYKNLVAYTNNYGDGDLQKVKIVQWNGSQLKYIAPIQNANKPSAIDSDKTLHVYTKSGKLTFKIGQYIKQIDGQVSKP